MTDPNFYIIMASAALAGLGMTTFAFLTGWRGWHHRRFLTGYVGRESVLRIGARRGRALVARQPQ